MEPVSSLQVLAERLAAGKRLSDADARHLVESRDLIALGTMADDERRRRHGARTTFVRVFEVHVDAPPAALPSPLAAGEIRIVGVPRSLDSAVDAVSAVRPLAADLPLTGFSLADLAGLEVPLADAAGRLRDAGLDAIADVPADRLSDSAAVETARKAGLGAERLTIHEHGDRSPLEVVQLASGLQARAGGFRVFAPLPRVVSPVTPTTGYDDVKLIAIARLMMTDIASIQVDWALYGPKLAQVALTMGADDVDGVAAFDPAALGARRSALAEITGNIRAASLDPVERDGRFGIIGENVAT
jgi:aminodeoxyfutalosine synthase